MKHKIVDSYAKLLFLSALLLLAGSGSPLFAAGGGMGGGGSGSSMSGASGSNATNPHAGMSMGGGGSGSSMSGASGSNATNPHAGMSMGGGGSISGHPQVGSSEPLPPGEGVLSGRLIFAGEGDASLGDLDTNLFAFENSAVAGEWSYRTDDEGRFEFSGLNTRDSVKYIVSVKFQGAAYLSEGSIFASGADRLDTQVTVYPSGPTPGDLQIKNSAIYVEPNPSTDALHITEVLHVLNPKKVTLLGGAKSTTTLELDLSEGIRNFQVVKGMLPTQVSLTDKKLLYGGAIYPGSSHVVFSYEVPPQALWIYRRRYEVPVGEVEVFVPAGGPPVLSPKLALQGPVELEGRAFDRYVGSAARGGVMFQVGGAEGVAARGGSSSSVPAMPLSVGTGALLVAFVLWPLTRKSPSAAPPSGRVARALRRRQLLVERDRLLESVKDLDFDFRCGKLSEEDYNAMREEEKQAAIKTMMALEELEEAQPDRRKEQDIGAAGSTRNFTPAAGRFCTACGAPSDSDDRFCGACGHALRRASA